MTGLIFDGFVLGQHGIIQACDIHDITLNDMVVRTSRANGMTAQPYHSWAMKSLRLGHVISPLDP